MAKVINSSSEFESTLRSAGEKLVVVDFTASWCGPCKAIAPTFESLAKSNPNVVFIKVDVDQNQSTAQKYGVRAMPTFLFMKKGAILDTLRGANAGQLTSLTQQYSKGGAGASGNFPGGGQTISGGSSAGRTPIGGARGGGAGGGLLDQLARLPRENLLPLVVILAYLAHVFFGTK